MRKTLLVICGIACVTGLHAQDVERTQDGAKNFIRTQNVTEEIRFYSDDIVRVIKYPSRHLPDKKKLSRHQNPGRRKPVLHGTRRQSVHKDGEYGSRHGQEFGKNHFQGCPRQFISAGKRIRHKLHSVQRRAV